MADQEEQKNQSSKEEDKEPEKEQQKDKATGTAREKGPEPVEEKVSTPESDKKHRKVSRLSLEKIEKALSAVQQNMGGFDSKYARFLLARKEMLLKRQKAIPLKKAA